MSASAASYHVARQTSTANNKHVLGPEARFVKRKHSKHRCSKYNADAENKKRVGLRLIKSDCQPTAGNPTRIASDTKFESSQFLRYLWEGKLRNPQLNNCDDQRIAHYRQVPSTPCWDIQSQHLNQQPIRDWVQLSTTYVAYGRGHGNAQDRQV